MEDIKKILYEGTEAQRRYLFSIEQKTTAEDMVKKFNIFTRYFYPKFFKSKDAPFHREMLLNLAKLYRGDIDEFLNIGFRGCSKTTYTKLFLVYIIACDTQHTRKYIKVLSEDIKNSKQVITDIYNLLITPRVSIHYPELFEKTEYKREETMERFTTSTGIKIVSGSVGQEQRGQIQEDSRPDFLWFDDIESRNTLRSAITTRNIWDNTQEAITGLARGGATAITANYISERGNVHRFVERIKNKMIIPIEDRAGNPTWGRYTRAEIDILRAKADDFQGEYLCSPSASKDVFFSRDSVDKQEAILPIKISNGMKIFKEYKTSHRVAGGADIALGVGLDSSTSVFIDFETIPAQVIATYHNNEIQPKEFGDELAKQGRIFGECMIAPESNNAGISTIDRLKDIYPISRIYAADKNMANINYARPTKFGWDTNSMTKSKMLQDLSEAVDNGWISLNDEDLIREVRGYTRNDLMDREVDPRIVTRHFDLLIALCIAFQMKDYAKKGSEPQYIDPITMLFQNNKDYNNFVQDQFE